ncbi:MAG: MraY family glycosyltransferase [Pseudonocardiaceae bacterium]
MSAPLVLRALRRRSVLDVPNERSSHTSPIPRGGGVAPVLGVLAAVVVARLGHTEAAIALAVATVGFGALGLAEDVSGVPPLRRLMLQVAIALATLPWLLDGLGGSLGWRLLFAAGVVFWLVGYVNAFNFMDGINGISVAQATVAGLAWLAVGTIGDAPALAAGGLIVATAALAFGPFNFPRARMFLGDVGSYGIGAALAALAVVGLRAGVPPEAILAPLALYLVDTSSTFVRRILIGETWYRPHCDHRYQRLVKLGWSHTRTTLFVAAVMAGAGGLGAVSLTGSLAARVIADVALVALLLGYLSAPTALRLRRGLPAVEQAEPAVPAVPDGSAAEPGTVVSRFRQAVRSDW